MTIEEKDLHMACICNARNIIVEAQMILNKIEFENLPTKKKEKLLYSLAGISGEINEAREQLDD
jgi:hypothetical protein